MIDNLHEEHREDVVITIVDLHDEMVDVTPLLKGTCVIVLPDLLLKNSMEVVKLLYMSFGQYSGSISSRRTRSRSMTGRSTLTSGYKSIPRLFEQRTATTR